MRQKSDKVNTALLKLLGINHRHLVGVDISMKPGTPPLVTLQQVLYEAPPVGDELAQRTVHLQVVDVTETHTPFDVRTACALALARIHKCTEQQAKQARAAIWREHVQAVSLSNQRHLGAQVDHWIRQDSYRAALIMKDAIRQDAMRLETEGGTL